MDYRWRFDIRLDALLPFVAGGSVALFILGVDVLVSAYWHGLSHGERLSVLGITSGAFVFFSVWCIVRLFLLPIKAVVDQSKTLDVLNIPPDNSHLKLERTAPELSKFGYVMYQMTQALGKVEAQALFPEILGQSRLMRNALAQAHKVSKSDSTVLILGESGTGKELFARAIHGHSKREQAPFIAVNCAAIPEGLLESELFGHEKGAFTGADSVRKGKLELAHTGTLFLDEIGDMPLGIQAKILRVLEGGACERVGGNRSIKFDVRFLAATNRDLTELVKEGLFREDLFHRLNVFPLMLPLAFST